MLWVGAREDGAVITRGWGFSKFSVEDLNSEAGLKRFIREKGVTSENQSLCLVTRAITQCLQGLFKVTKREKV